MPAPSRALGLAAWLLLSLAILPTAAPSPLVRKAGLRQSLRLLPQRPIWRGDGRASASAPARRDGSFEPGTRVVEYVQRGRHSAGSEEETAECDDGTVKGASMAAVTGAGVATTAAVCGGALASVLQYLAQGTQAFFPLFSLSLSFYRHPLLVCSIPSLSRFFSWSRLFRNLRWRGMSAGRRGIGRRSHLCRYHRLYLLDRFVGIGTSGQCRLLLVSRKCALRHSSSDFESYLVRCPAMLLSSLCLNPVRSRMRQLQIPQDTARQF